jgi:redox-sensitive bicupin YhaK (pirin superfamily)
LITAGSGIIHQEMPQPKDKMLGCQLWVNLPAKNKMTQPAYKDITEKDVKIVNEENAIIRIISGNYQGFSGAFTGNFVKVQYLDITLNPEKVWNYSESPNDETLFIYLLDGSLAVDNQLEHFEQKSCAILFASSNRNPDEKEQMTVKAGEEGARFILLSAKPLNEPIAWGGPIVMNTRDELNLAFEELDNGTFIKHP